MSVGEIELCRVGLALCYSPSRARAVFSSLKTPSRTAARMEPSSPVLNELSLLLERIVATLPPEVLPLVLRHLPTVELARLSCVHKAFRVAWHSLRVRHLWRRFDPPTHDDLEWAAGRSRLERAAAFGDVAVVQSLLAAGVDESGAPLSQVDNAGASCKRPCSKRLAGISRHWS